MSRPITNWGHYPVIQAHEVTFVAAEQLPDVVTEACIARGNGRCYGDSSLAKTVISTRKFDKLLAFDAQAGIVHCQAGVMLAELLDVLVPRGWFLPVTPGTKYITVGGAVASDVHGKNHHVDGAFCNHVLDMTVLTGRGLQRCSAVENADLFAATCGGMGLTGIILDVRLRLKQIHSAYIRQRQVKAANLDEVLDLFAAYAASTYSVAWIDCLQTGKRLGRSILLLGEHATPEEVRAVGIKEPLHLPTRKKVTVPFYFPSVVLNAASMRAFNALYYHKNLKKTQDRVVSYEDFFYPLDALLHWNRIYGRKGFVQYQFVLPKAGGQQGLVDILRSISQRGMGSFLAVLKLFGPQDSLIAFPMEGYTLALDFPIRRGLFEFLDDLDRIVLAYSGRLYLSKDARMQSDVFWKGYPHSGKFLAIVQKYNPGFRFRSVQSDRLGITGDTTPPESDTPDSRNMLENALVR
jgi:decaprenylphospho-beta-D-ribofuranose 2-oxidase